MDEIACFDKDQRRTVSSLRPTGSLALDLPVAYAHEHTVLFSPLFLAITRTLGSTVNKRGSSWDRIYSNRTRQEEPQNV